MAKGTTNRRHLHIAKLIPQVFDCVKADNRSAEEANPLHATHAADAQPCQTQPGIPLQGEAGTLQAMESRPAHCRREGEAEEHRVQQDETGDGGIGVLKQNHQANQPDGGAAKVQVPGRVVREWNANCTEQGIERPHEGVVDIFWVFLARLELKRSIVTGKVAREANQHLAKGWMDIEVELAFEIVGAEFSEAILGQPFATVWRSREGVRMEGTY